MAESAVYLQARVIQKVATEAEWQDINLAPLIDGELYLYRDVDGTPRNFKIGDGVNQPRDIPYFFDASIRVPFFGTATPSSTPSPASGNGFWIATEAGTYTNYGGVVLPANSFGIITRVGTTYGILIATIDLSGYLTEDDIDTQPGGNNEANPATAVQGAINSTGGLGSTTNVNRKAIVGQPALPNQQYTISGMTPAAGKSLAWKNSSGAVIGSVIALSTLPMTLTSPAGTATVDYTVRLDELNDDSWINSLMFAKGTNTNYEPYGSIVTGILDMPIMADFLSENATVSNPQTNSSPIPKGYADTTYVAKSSILSTVGSNNLLNPNVLLFDGDWSAGGVLNDYAVNNGGELLPSVGWKTNITPVKPSTFYTFGRINISSTGNSVFLVNKTNVGRLYNGVFSTGETQSFQSASNSAYLATTLKRPADNDTVWSAATINEGQVLLPYDEFEEYVTSIDGKEIKASGGTNYDQSLNTTDEVIFQKVTTTSLETQTLIAILPEGAGSPPVGVQIGDAWIDTTDNTIKVRRS